MESGGRFVILSVAFTAMVFVVCGDQGNHVPAFKPSCKCINYNNEYMNCDCCPPGVSTEYVYRIDYRVESYINRDRSMKICHKEWSTDPAILCDCLFCGSIRNTSHPKFALCMDMDLYDLPFSLEMDYTLNVTVNKSGMISNANLVINAGESILKPDPVESIEVESILTSNNVVQLKVTWEPDFHVSFNRLKFWISWAKLGENKVQHKETTKNEIVLQDVEPNSVYKVQVKCRPVRGGYYSALKSLSVQTAEKCFESSPTLVNFIADTSKCAVSSDTPCVTVTVFWQHLPPELRWANCTRYLLQITGSFGNFTQFASCTDVMAVLEQKLPYGQTYNVSLRVVSDIYYSPASYLSIRTSKELSEQRQETLETKVLRVDRNSSIIVSIPLPRSLDPPSQYGIFYCKEGNDAPCERDVKEDLIDRQHDSTMYVMPDHGPDYLYNVASYWGVDTTGLSSQWLCPYDYCGKLVQPQMIPTDVRANSYTFKLSEFRSIECSSASKRGLPHRFEVTVSSPDEKTVFSITVSGPDSQPIKVSSLTPSTTYKVSVRIQGYCGETLDYTDQFITAVKDDQGNWTNYLLVAISVLVGIVLIVFIIGCVIYSRNKKIRQLHLEAKTRHSVVLSSVSASTNGYYIKRWLENHHQTGSSNYPELLQPNPEVPEVQNDVDDSCPETVGKWCQALCCPKTPVSENEHQSEEDSKMALLKSTEREAEIVNSIDGERNAASVTKTTEIELESMTKEVQKPAGDSGCEQGSSSDKFVDKSQVDTNSRDTDSRSGCATTTTTEELSSSEILPEIHHKGEEPVSLPDNISKSSEHLMRLLQDCDTDSLKGQHNKIDLHIGNNMTANDSLPSYTKFASDGWEDDSLKLPKSSNYQSLPLAMLNNSSDDVQTYSDSDSHSVYDEESEESEENSTDQSALPFVKKIPLLGDSNVIV